MNQADGNSIQGKILRVAKLTYPPFPMRLFSQSEVVDNSLCMANLYRGSLLGEMEYHGGLFFLFFNDKQRYDGPEPK